MTPRAQMAVLAPLLALAGCRGCTYGDGERTFESLDASVRVELVREAHSGWGVASLFPSGTKFVVRVSTTPPFDEAIECSEADLAEDPKGTVVAYKCRAPGAVWEIIRLGSGGTHVVDCANDLGAGPKPDFAKLRPLSDVASAIAACFETHCGLSIDMEKRIASLVDMLRDAGGAAAVRKFLVDESDRAIPACVADEEDDPWVVDVAHLPPADRADLETALCPTLLDPGKDEAYVRAARICPIGDERAGDAALARARAAFASPPLEQAWPKRGLPPDWALPLAFATRPSETGAMACAFLATAGVHDLRLTTLALAAVAASNTKCAAVRAMAPVACDPSLDCDDKLCTAKELLPALESWGAFDANVGDAGARPPRRPPDLNRTLLAAIYASGPLPREVVVRNARRRYAIDTGEGAPCDDRLDAGASCNCTGMSSSSRWLCDLPLDGGRRDVEGHCAARADDRARRVGWVKHACAKSLEACVMDDDCCASLTCDAEGAELGACR